MSCEGQTSEHDERLSEFKTAGGDFSTADPASERVLLEIDEPDWNHNSGRNAFGSDGFLYWTVGNGGAFHDVGDVARADAGILAGLQGRRT